jgi:PHD/YefM family antitoxin component YafN of YafNO toxin-antitoxin module
MQVLTLSRFEKDSAACLKYTVQFGEPLTIAADYGNAVIMSEEEYRGIIAMQELMQDKKAYAELLEAANEPLENCVDESEVNRYG